VVVANLTPGEGDGRWSALYGARVYRWAKTLGYLYQAELRSELTRTLGLAWGPVRNGGAEIAGVPADLLQAFSTRRAQITAALEASGGHSRSAATAATLATRAPKHTVADLASLRLEWDCRRAELGVAPDVVAAVCGRAHPQPVPLDPLTAELLGPSGLTRQSSSFDRRDALQALAAAHPGGAPVGELRRATDVLLDHPDVVALATTTPAGPRYATTQLIRLEAELLRRAAATVAVRTVPGQTLLAVLDARALSAEQQHMVASLCRSDAAVQVVVGRAGTGKTYALDAARTAWAATGRPVIGTALAARAAAELQAGTGIPSDTLDRLLTDLDRPGPLRGLPPGAVVVCDEAGMVGTRKLARLLAHTRAVGAQLVLVGDPRQLPAIDAGGALAALARTVPTVELVETRRQTEIWERGALAELRAGSVATAVVAYHEKGRVTLAPKAEVARERLVGDWWAARTDGASAAMYALRRADVDDLNRRARLRLDAAGALGEQRIQVADRELAIGDEILCLRNDRRLGVRNGTTGTVAAVAADQIVLADGTRISGDYLAAGHVTHAYATTIHKAQGATVERAFLLGSDALYREAGYVGLSRARTRTDLYLVTAAEDLGPDTLTTLTRQLSATRAEDLAVEQLHRPAIAALARDPERSAALADPAPWLLAALGPPPLHGPDRDRWAERAQRIAAYRDIHAVTGPDPLGPETADDPQRRAWALARMAIDEHRRDLGLDLGLGR
jgi:hypothetical protein